MMPLDRALVRRKLQTIRENLGDLAHASHWTLDQYQSDRVRLKGIERLIQESIDAAADANRHMLREASGAVPSDYFDSFVALGRHGIVSADLARALAPAAGLRNRLVHEYDAVDDTIVLRSIRTMCDLLPRYLEAVETYLDRS